MGYRRKIRGLKYRFESFYVLDMVLDVFRVGRKNIVGVRRIEYL